MGKRCAAGLGLAAALALGPGAAAAAAAETPEARPPPEGALVGWKELLGLRAWLPPEVWRHRDRFFHTAMQLQIGPQQRDYPVPRAFREASGGARLDTDGNLHGHTPGSGLPFPPEAIDPAAPDAGLRWAWNMARRHRGAGPRGSFLLVDLPDRVGGVQNYLGEWFQLVPGGDDASFTAGGRFLEPAPVRHLAWQQRRPRAAAAQWSLPDETFVYLPSARKVRRAAGVWVDGFFTPNYRSPVGPSAPGGAVGGTGLAATDPLRRGWLGLALRPNAYIWRLAGEREVLAPINVARPGYPLSPRGWGKSGLSPADDRWELRRAVVIEGVLREPRARVSAVTLYVDAQTLQPLYYASRSAGGRLLETGILLHRFSGDVEGYPPGVGGTAAAVFDPVAAVFVETGDGGSGWRRESYDVISTPPSDAERRRLTGPEYLGRGR